MIKLWKRQKISLPHTKIINKFCLSLFIIIYACALLILQPISKIPVKVYAFTQSRGECCVEIGTNTVLFEHNSRQKLPMASTTKVITAITVLENAGLSEIVEIDADCVGIEGSSIYLKEGEKYTVEDLLYGLMLRSGNDAAVALAMHVGKNINNFCEMMNDICRKVGANNTNVTNPHGLNDENHYTTAEDLAKIAAYALKNETFKQIVSTQKRIATELISGNKRTFINKNKLLYRDKNCYGVKTGYTKIAGRCLVSAFENDGMNLVCVVLNSPQMYERSEEIAQICFQNYVYKLIVDKQEFEKVFSIDEMKTLTIDGDIKEIKLKDDNRKNYEARITLNDFAKTAKKGSILGKIDIYSQNQLIYSRKIYTLIDITNERLMQILKDKAQNYQRYI